jgi:nucleoid DNA-binding protein
VNVTRLMEALGCERRRTERDLKSSQKMCSTELTRRLQAFVQEVTATLVEGNRHRTPGLGTFSTCIRRATRNRCAGRMAMFRASAELRDYASGGPLPVVSGPHAEVVNLIVEAMRSEQGANVPRLGRMAVVPVSGRKPKLIFHGAKELNDVLAG